MRRRIFELTLATALLMVAACGPPETGWNGPPVGDLHEVLPEQVPVGASAELRGWQFGSTQEDGWVTVGGVPARIQAWASDRILIEVPQVGPGEVLVVINWPSLRSNPAPLTVLP